MTNPLRQPRRLDDLLNFQLHMLQAVSGAPIVRLLEGRHGITRREWRLLALLADRGPLSPSTLAEQGQLDRARTSRSIGMLVAKQLALRETLASDPRRAQVSLTAAGRRLYDEVFPEIAAINAQLVSALDDATVDALATAIERLKAKAQELNLALATDIKAGRGQGGSRRKLQQRGAA
ncbi:MarR family winged helix-turn-helix transcriptional regulator [Rhodoferax sp. BAB1]|uniref:MarR family winged helix-turn-helix transcriptional regulator n=1 Tax=Rhodoferax sp. BAB1 TaxID=2741720 RepID=UPI0020C7235D|nr:MarR family transcriptional regulator [Rhodoferax sp. BAB1]